jgi:hypothetical protein
MFSLLFRFCPRTMAGKARAAEASEVVLMKSRRVNEGVFMR